MLCMGSAFAERSNKRGIVESTFGRSEPVRFLNVVHVEGRSTVKRNLAPYSRSAHEIVLTEISYFN
jgi:hypothetical protein